MLDLVARILGYWLLVFLAVAAAYLAAGALAAHCRRWKQDLRVRPVSDPPALLRRRPVGSRHSLEIAIEAPDNVEQALELLERVR